MRLPFFERAWAGAEGQARSLDAVHESERHVSDATLLAEGFSMGWIRYLLASNGRNRRVAAATISTLFAWWREVSWALAVAMLRARSRTPS